MEPTMELDHNAYGLFTITTQLATKRVPKSPGPWGLIWLRKSSNCRNLRIVVSQVLELSGVLELSQVFELSGVFKLSGAP